MATPLWLSDNLCDEIGATPTAILDTNGAVDDAPGHEIWRIADGLRDRTWWTPTTANVLHNIRVRLSSPRVANVLVLDRGHNLRGAVVQVGGYSAAGVPEAAYVNATIPTTPGGLPTDANGCLTPTGEWWIVYAGASHATHIVSIPAMGAGRVPLITGMALGQAYRWPSHWDAPSAYDDRRRVSWAFNRESEAGVRVRRGRRVHRRLAMRTEINGEDWTAPLQAEFARVVDRGLPVWHCTDDATAAGAGALGFFHVADDVDFDPIQNPVHRELQLELDEVAPVRQR